MDAGNMDGSSLLFGGSRSRARHKEPNLVAKLLVREQQKGLLPWSGPTRVPGRRGGSQLLSGTVCPRSLPDSLISDEANKLFRHYKKKLDSQAADAPASEA